MCPILAMLWTAPLSLIQSVRGRRSTKRCVSGAASLDMFSDGPNAKAREAVHLVFAGEKVRPDYLASAQDISESEATESFRVVTLEALVRMKLTSFRDKDRMHLRDLIDVGLVDP